jgi:hypothetical protein
MKVLRLLGQIGGCVGAGAILAGADSIQLNKPFPSRENLELGGGLHHVHNVVPNCVQH